MALPVVLLKAKSAISKGAKAVKMAKEVKSATSNSNENELKKIFVFFLRPFLPALFIGGGIALFILFVFMMIVSFPQVLYDQVWGTENSSGVNGNYTGNLGYVKWAIDIANDDSHGYSQGARTGPDYDCSSLVYYSLLNSGYTAEQIGSTAFSTRDMSAKLENAGFEKHEISGAILQEGDILWRHGHTGIYIGNNQIVHAVSDENGGLGGQPGDQTGREIRVESYDTSGNWTFYFRKV